MCGTLDIVSVLRHCQLFATKLILLVDLELCCILKALNILNSLSVAFVVVRRNKITEAA